MAHGKVPWILGLQVRKPAMDLREAKPSRNTCEMACSKKAGGVSDCLCIWFVYISYMNFVTSLYFGMFDT